MVAVVGKEEEDHGEHSDKWGMRSDWLAFWGEHIAYEQLEAAGKWTEMVEMLEEDDTKAKFLLQYVRNCGRPWRVLRHPAFVRMMEEHKKLFPVGRGDGTHSRKRTFDAFAGDA